MWIKTYILTIATVVLFSVFAESLMPDSKMKKHISLVAGLIILFAIAKPLISVNKFSLTDVFSDFSEDVDVSGEALSKKINNAQTMSVNSDFAKRLSSEISSKIENTMSIKCKVEVIIEENKVKLVKIHSLENSQIKKLVVDTYGLVCVFEGDGGQSAWDY